MLGNLTLRPRLKASKTVPEYDDLSLAFVQYTFHQRSQPLYMHPHVDVVRNVVLGADNVHVSKRVALFIDVYLLVYRHLVLELFLAPEEHKNFVRYPHLTARR